jgi:hypothetical protein
VQQKLREQALVRAFTALNSSFRLILVDWRAQMALSSVTSGGGIGVWRP